MSSTPPSSFLPPLYPLPLPSALAPYISLLSSSCAPSSAIVDLRPAVASYDPALAGAEEEADAFETTFAQGWLEKVVALGARALTRGEHAEWEAVVESAARLLAALSGPSGASTPIERRPCAPQCLPFCLSRLAAQGSVTKTYLLPRTIRLFDGKQTAYQTLGYPTPPPTRPASVVPFERSSPATAQSTTLAPEISLTIRDGTLVEASTGHRTWGAASIFAHRLASSPSTYLPLTPNPGRILRVLELGSGTGLVGLATAKVLEALDVPARVVLSDGGDEPQTVLANLRENVSANLAPPESAECGVKVDIERLDWRDYLPSSSSYSTLDHSQGERHDLILGSDLAYERGQATLLHAAVAGLLRFPSPLSSTADDPRPVFWLTIALRPTHRFETAEVDAVFPSASSAPAPDPSLLRQHDGKAYRLVTASFDEVVGPDGFAGRAVRGRVAARGEMRYRTYRIEWQEVLVRA